MYLNEILSKFTPSKNEVECLEDAPKSKADGVLNAEINYKSSLMVGCMPIYIFTALLPVISYIWYHSKLYTSELLVSELVRKLFKWIIIFRSILKFWSKINGTNHEEHGIQTFLHFLNMFWCLLWWKWIESIKWID